MRNIMVISSRRLLYRTSGGDARSARLSRQPQETPGVLAVDAAEDVRGEPDAVDGPAALDRRRVTEVLVPTLEVAPGRGEEVTHVALGRRGRAGRSQHEVVLVD